MAVELQGLGLIEKVFPVFVGNIDPSTGEYGNYFGGGCHPPLPDVTVRAVEEKLSHHMESQALGTPLEPDRTVLSVVTAMTACQGAFIQGEAEGTFAAAAMGIAKMLTEDNVVTAAAGTTAPVTVTTTVTGAGNAQVVSPRGGVGGGGVHVQRALLEMREAELAAEKAASKRLAEEVRALTEEVGRLRKQ